MRIGRVIILPVVATHGEHAATHFVLHQQVQVLYVDRRLQVGIPGLR